MRSQVILSFEVQLKPISRGHKEAQLFAKLKGITTALVEVKIPYVTVSEMAAPVNPA